MKWTLRVLLAMAVLAGALWYLGPYEPVDLDARLTEPVPAADVDGYLARQEARFDDIVPGTAKRVVWAGAPGIRTAVALVYLHGFSATSEEIRPVPDRLAAGLNANLVFTRLQGHGRKEALAEATVGGWARDLDEALQVARAVGERVLILSTSTGGTLAAVAALSPDLAEDLAGVVFVAPNFGINHPLEPLMTAPAARMWLPVLAGETYAFEPRSPDVETYWTTRYPSVAILPMAALVRHVSAQDFSRATVPALFWYSDDDTVVRAEATDRVAEAWGGPVTVRKVVMGEGDDPSSHVVAGDIQSPGQTDRAVTEMLDWSRAVLAGR